MSSLQYIWKLIEKVVAEQIYLHLENNDMLDPYQSRYRKHHSTEIAKLHVTNDMLQMKDYNQSAALVSVDLSAHLIW